MRINTPEDFEKSIKDKVKTYYITNIPQDLQDYKHAYGKIPDSYELERKYANVISCKLKKLVNKKLNGYLMRGTSGHGFSCDESLVYELNEISLNTSIFKNNKGEYLEKYPNNRTFYAYAHYKNLTDYNENKYTDYIENGLVSKEEYKEMNNITKLQNDNVIYFDNPVQVFTTYGDAEYFVKCRLCDMVDKIVEEIDRKVNQKKEMYFNLKYKIRGY